MLDNGSKHFYRKVRSCGSFSWWLRPWHKDCKMKTTTEIEYRVRPVTRFVVTRFHLGSGSETRGEFDHPDTAYDVAYSLCKVEHEAHGWPLDDVRIQYPKRLVEKDTLVDGVPTVFWTPAKGEPYRGFNAPPKAEAYSAEDALRRVRDLALQAEAAPFIMGEVVKVVDGALNEGTDFPEWMLQGVDDANEAGKLLSLVTSLRNVSKGKQRDTVDWVLSHMRASSTYLPSEYEGNEE